MFGYPLVNVLGACLIITSMMVVLARTGRAAAFLYSLQSLVLVGVLASLGAVTGSTELFTWSATAFATKVVLVPAILLFTLKKIGDDAEADLPPKLNPMKSVALVAVEVFVCFVAVSGIDLPTAAAVFLHAGRVARASSSSGAHLHRYPALHLQADLPMLPDGERLPCDARASGASGAGWWRSASPPTPSSR